MPKPMYQIALLDAIGGKSAILRSTLEAHFKDLTLDPADALEVLDASQIDRLRPDATRVGVLFSDSAAGQRFKAEVQMLLDSPAVVVPAVLSLDDFPNKVPDNLTATNGMKLEASDARLEKLAGLVLELFGLLRRRRRLFVSYRRIESSAVAQQLYHALDERAFDVFLDTLSVRAADAFQEQLWHRMSDSDVVVLLYTQKIHDSGWVQQEIDRASGMKVTVLQVIWPGVKRDPRTRLFEPLYLDTNDFENGDSAKPLTNAKALEICALVESLRARSHANRQAELVGTLRERAAKRRLTTVVQPSRAVDVICADDTFTRVFPAVGVPDSESFQTDALAPVQGTAPAQIALLYDSLNIAPAWREHLDWLHKYLPVKTVKVMEVDKWLTTLCT